MPYAAEADEHLNNIRKWERVKNDAYLLAEKRRKDRERKAAQRAALRAKGIKPRRTPLSPASLERRRERDRARTARRSGRPVVPLNLDSVVDPEDYAHPFSDVRIGA